MKAPCAEWQTLWKECPALLYGTSFLLGTLFFLLSPYALLPLPLLLYPRPLLSVLLCFCAPLCLLYHLYYFPPSATPIRGTFHIETLSTGKHIPWIYRGTLYTERGRVRCTLSSKIRYRADCDYLLSGKLFTQEGITYFLKTEPAWEKLESFSCAELRYQVKQKVKAYISKHIPSPRAAAFLKNLVTGEGEDSLIAHDFSLLGLSHLLAVSGFHFSLLSATLYFLFPKRFPYKARASLLLLFLTGYLFFLGPTPSVYRAWMAALLFFTSHLVERPARPLNSLGVALLLLLLIDPLAATTLSFSLSFLATAGILLGYHPCHTLLTLWIPSYSLSKVSTRSFLWQHGYLLLGWIRKGLALTLSVHLALFPLLLHAFHTLSWNSLLYNLFFPLCAAVGLLLFLAGVLTFTLLHPLANWYNDQLLALTEAPPSLFATAYYESPPPLFTTLYLALLFFFLLRHQQKAPLLSMNQER